MKNHYLHNKLDASEQPTKTTTEKLLTPALDVLSMASLNCYGN